MTASNGTGTWHKCIGSGYSGSDWIVKIDDNGKKVYNLDMNKPINALPLLAIDGFTIEHTKDGNNQSFNLRFIQQTDDGDQIVSSIRLTDKQLVRLEIEVNNIANRLIEEETRGDYRNAAREGLNEQKTIQKTN